MKNYKKRVMTISVTDDVYDILKASSNNMSGFICDLVKQHHYTKGSMIENSKVKTGEMFRVEI